MFVVELLAVFLFSDAYANTTIDSLALAHKFSPILILTEATSREFGNIRVTKPEPVEIVDADSSSSLWASAYRRNENSTAMSALLNSPRWDPRMDVFQENRWYPNGKVIFQENKFAFVDNVEPRLYAATGGGLTPGNGVVA